MRKREIGVKEAITELDSAIESLLYGEIATARCKATYRKIVSLYRRRAANQKTWDTRIEEFEEDAQTLRDVLDGVVKGEREFSAIRSLGERVLDTADALEVASIKIATCRTQLPGLIIEFSQYINDTPAWTDHKDTVLPMLKDFLVNDMRLKKEVAEQILPTAMNIFKKIDLLAYESKPRYCIPIDGAVIKALKAIESLKRWEIEDLGREIVRQNYYALRKKIDYE